MPARKRIALAVDAAIRADESKATADAHKRNGYIRWLKQHGKYHGKRDDAMTTNRDDASETAGGELISNKTIRRHAHALADIARTGGRTNPKNHHPGNSPDARREMAIQHLTEAARTNRDDADPPEEHDMADVAELKSRLDKMREEIDQICDALADDDDDDVRDDAESASERSAAASLGDYHRHGEHESEHHVRDDEDKEEEEHDAGEELDQGKEDEEHDAGEELDQGKEDEEHGEEAKGEEEEHEAGEEEAAARDDAESEAERSEASEEGHEHHDEEEAEHAEDRGDRSPTEMAEELTEADAMTSAEHAAAARKAWRTRKRDDAQANSDAEIRAKIARLEARLARAIRPVSRQERDAMAAAQARCDSVAQMFGLKAEPPLAGEHLDSYRRRLVAPLQKYSKRWAKTSLDRAPDDTFANIEEQIYADAQAAAKLDGAPEAGRLVPVRSVDAAGRTITKFYGDPNAWMAPFKARGLSIRINGVGRRD